MANAGSATGNQGTNLFGQPTNPSSTNSEQELLGQLSGATAPSTANAQLQYNLGQDQLGLVNSNLASSEAYNNAMAGYQQGGLGISAQQSALQGTGLQQQGAQNVAQQGIEQQSYGLQSGQYPEQQAEAATAYQNAMMNIQGGNAISGTQNTVGGKAAVSTEQQQYGFQTEDIARAQALAGLGQQSEESGYQYSGEELQTAQQNLALNAQANGLSQQQLLTMLNYSNQQAGTGAQQDILSLYANQGNVASGNLSNVGAAIAPIGFGSSVAQNSGINTLAGVG